MLTTLDNGLTLIIREDHSAPVVSAQAWCMAGSIHEGSWLGAGLSHVLEHMLFKGTASRPGSRIDQEVQEAGGYMNAYTSFDRTVYHIDVPNTGARVAIDILCDIMQHASLPADELAKEMQVIRREMDMNIDDPHRRASRRLFETAYTRSPYRYTVIGYPDIFDELKSDDIRAYYRQKYAPNNVFFVVVGDIHAPDVIAQVRESWKQAKSRPLPPVVLPDEPRQTAPRETVESAPIELGHVHFAWHIPDLRHPDVPVLDIAAAMLGCGRSSRLYQQVREIAGLVHSVDAWTYSPGNPGLLGISATLDPEQFSNARAAILAEVDRLQAELVAGPELAKAVKQFVTATLSSRKTMQGQAQDLGSNWLATGDLAFSERYLAAVQRATPEDVRRVARTYLVPENRTLYALMPQAAAVQTQAAAALTAEQPTRLFTLPNGLRLLLKEDHRLPFVELRAVFRGGVLAETAESNGLTALMAKLLLKGTATRTAEQIAGEIESLGGSLDSYSGNNSFGLNAEVLSPDFSTGLHLLADVILNPAFPAEALEREREVQIAAIRSQRDQLLQSASRLMRQTLFGKSGYGLDALGTEPSVGRLSVANLQAFHRAFARPENCVLAVFGDIQTQTALEAVTAAFASWQGSPANAPAGSSLLGMPGSQLEAPVAPWGARGGPARVEELRPKKQSVLVIGFPGARLGDSERYALDLLQEACSDLGSRLFLRVRDQLGLAYYVGAQNFVGVQPGCFSFYVGTKPEQADLVEGELFKEAALLRAEGLTADELNRAKAKIIGHRKIARQDLGGLAQAMSLDELYGLGFQHQEREDSYYQAVSLEQIRAAAVKYLCPEVGVVARIMPEPGAVESAEMTLD